MKDLDLYKSLSQSDTHIQRHFRNLQQSARPISSSHKPITNRLFYVTAAGPALCIRCQKCLNISESHIQRHFRQPNWHLTPVSQSLSRCLASQPIRALVLTDLHWKRCKKCVWIWACLSLTPILWDTSNTLNKKPALCLRCPMVVNGWNK